MIIALSPSQNAFDLIRKLEDCELVSYTDSGGVWTIGFGHTGPEVTPGMLITQQQADQFLNHDVDLAAGYVNECVTGQINQNQFDALCSFVFNEGEGKFKTSTMLKYINQDRCDEAADQFDRWIYGNVNGVMTVLPGLVTRRAEEKALFIKEIGDA